MATDAERKAALEDKKALELATQKAALSSAAVAKSNIPTKGHPACSGRIGGAFGVDGEGFGSSGTLTVGGQHVPTTRWTDKNIRGTLSQHVKAGEVVILCEDGTTQKTTFKGGV